MSCYHPNFMYLNNGEIGRFGGPLTQAKIDAMIPGQDYAQIPCGKCLGCRLDKSKAWADRMLLEFATEREDMPARTALFLTLTYDNDHVPWITCDDGLPGQSLEPKHTQEFMKRLRKYFEPKRLRYYLAGEYGDVTFRPHYHAIIYGIGLDDFPDGAVYSTDKKLGTCLYESEKLNRLWSKGAVRYAVATYSTFCYVGRYVVKKQYTGDFENIRYRGRVAPFSRSSLKPGLGADYFKDVQFTQVSVSDGVQVHKIGLPRCVFEKLQLTNPELYDKLKSQRRYVAEQHTELVKQQIEMPYFDYLKGCEEVHDSKLKSLTFRDKV